MEPGDLAQEQGARDGAPEIDAALVVARAVHQLAEDEDQSDEELTDAQHSSSDEEEGIEGVSGTTAGGGDGTPSPVAPAPTPVDSGGARQAGRRPSPAARAAATAVEAAVATGIAYEGRDWDRQLVSLAAIAEAHIQAGKLDKAVNEYSDMLRRSGMVAGGGGGCRAAQRRHAALLLARSAAYSAFSQQLRSIPAAQSESRALFAPDPCHLASLGLKDAAAAAGLDPESPEALLHKGCALFLLERYPEAEAAYQAGLQLQPTHQHLQERLSEVQAALERSGGSAGAGAGEAGAGGPVAGVGSAGGECRKLQQCDDTECPLCMRLLYEPVTTSCGHSFCKTCFSRAMDHGTRCPQCRTVLHAGRELAVTITLKNLLERSFTEEYEQRRQEELEAAAAVPAVDAPLPIFVMSLLLPGEKLALNIFEPRYRLMVRRCMEGNRTFGMATVNRQHQLSEVACEAEIVECQAQPDGRFYIEVVGRRRFRPVEAWEQDGYRLAKPEYLTDEVPPEGGEDAARLQQEAREVEAMADAWVERLRTLAQTRRGVAELLVRAGEKPAGATPEKLSFWVANLICPVLDVEVALKQRFVTTRSTLERLQTERQLLQQLNSSSSQGCTVM